MKIRNTLFAALALTMGSASANAAVIDLGFALDDSGSLGPTNFETMTDGLAAALAVIPTTGPNQYRISVVKFNTSASTIIQPTIVTAANLASLQLALENAAYSGGSTCISCGANLLTSNFTGAGGLNATALMNITTDGVPNVGVTNGTTLRGTLTGAGWDSISAEALGSFNTTYLTNLAYPQPGVFITDPANLPNPLNQGFVLRIDNINDYEGAITAKIGRIVNPTPEPGTLALFGLSMLGLGLMRRKATA